MSVLGFMAVFLAISYVVKLLALVTNVSFPGHVNLDLLLIFLRSPESTYDLCPLIMIISVFYVLARLQVKEETFGHAVFRG